MRLAALLAELPPEQLERLAAEHLGQEQNISRAALCSTLEGVLRSYSFVRDFIVNRQPPAFSILETLLEADEWTVALGSFRDSVMESTRVLCERVAAGDVIGRDDGLRLYRRVLTEARRSDLALDPSETAILGVLRRELTIRHVEHFLVEHHPDLQEFWSKELGFLHEMEALRASGLVFAHEGRALLAEEVVPLVRQTLGLEMSRGARRRLYEQLVGADLNEILHRCGLKTSGTKDDKVERLLNNYVQPTEVLQMLPLPTLRELCRVTHAQVSGSKDDLVERLVEHFLHALDQRPPTEPPPPPAQESRELDELRFRSLFGCLRGHELTDALASINSSRLTGSKDTKVSVLWQSPFAEVTLLSGLTNRCIEDVLSRNRLKTSGSKRERIDRVVEHFKTTAIEHLEAVIEEAPPSSSMVDVSSNGGEEPT